MSTWIVAVRECGPEERLAFLGPFRSRRRASDLASAITARIAAEDDPDATGWAYVQRLTSGTLVSDVDAVVAWATGETRDAS